MEKISGDGRQPGWKGVPESTQNLIAFTDAFAHVIESEPISSYMGKVGLKNKCALFFLDADLSDLSNFAIIDEFWKLTGTRFRTE